MISNAEAGRGGRESRKGFRAVDGPEAVRVECI